jgi:hypothetical protein
VELGAEGGLFRIDLPQRKGFQSSRFQGLARVQWLKVMVEIGMDTRVYPLRGVDSLSSLVPSGVEFIILFRCYIRDRLVIRSF